MKSECGGGDLISKIHNFVNHGDPFVQNFIHNFLCEVVKFLILINFFLKKKKKIKKKF